MDNDFAARVSAAIEAHGDESIARKFSAARSTVRAWADGTARPPSGVQPLVLGWIAMLDMEAVGALAGPGASKIVR